MKLNDDGSEAFAATGGGDIKLNDDEGEFFTVAAETSDEGSAVEKA